MFSPTDLREAFAIAQGTTAMLPERRHLEAVINYAGQLEAQLMETSQALSAAAAIFPEGARKCLES